jgi:hypothetical protein
VIVAASAAVAAAVGGGKNLHDCIINFAGTFFKSKVAPVHMTSASNILLAHVRKYCHDSCTQKMAVVALDICSM